MKRILSMLAAAIACTAAGAQTIDDILGQVGENNLTLKALQQQLDAGADANLAEARLEGPEVEFGYLFGEDGRRRHDFGVSQSFDFGALTGARKRLALGQNELLALEYRASRRDILTQARKLVYRIINCNALIAEYTHRADNARAVEWYTRAAEAGYAEAQYNLGYMYEQGRGVPQDYAKAVEWYRKAADNGEAAAMYSMGLMYDQGTGVQANLSEAQRWYELAAKNGDPDAKAHLRAQQRDSRK